MYHEQVNPVCNLKESTYSGGKICYLFIIFFRRTKNYFLCINVNKLRTLECDVDFVKISI